MKRIVRTLLPALALACSAVQAQSPAPAPAPAPMAAELTAIGTKPWLVETASAGSGRYTIIFESGFGMGLSAWRKVAPELAGTARVVAYSRAGHGRSEARPEPRTIAQNTNELEQLVAAGKLAPPFILVGHSYGALLVRSFAARHPGQVAGMVLVDPGDERFNPALRQLDAGRAAADERAFAAIVPAKFQPELALLQPVLDSGRLPFAGKLPDVPTVVLTSMQGAEKPEFFLETPEAVAIKQGLHADFVRQFSAGSQVLTARAATTSSSRNPNW
ncbi:alpha/beta fold hydrolase [Telluria sp. B2]